jgi:hypothetical protein
MFDGVPDVRLDVQDHAVTDRGFWLEAAQVGHRRDGRPLQMRTVFIAVVVDGRISNARMYAAPVEDGGPDVDGIFAGVAASAPPGSESPDDR